MATVLIADDEASVRDIVKRILAIDGHHVIEAGDGEEAMRKIRSEKPDLVMMDLFMPRKEGLETIMQLRRSFPEVKIIAISGGNPTHGMSFLETAKKFGAMRTLAKPFGMQEMRDAVSELLDSQQAEVVPAV